MTADELRCGDCGRDDFEDADELLDHDCDAFDDGDDDEDGSGAAPKLVADGGTGDECSECGAIVDEDDAIVTEDAVLACPCCGEVLERITANVTELLYAGGASQSGTDRKFHLSDDCRYLQRADDVYSCSVDHPPRGSLCSHCASGITLEDLTSTAPAIGGDA